MEPPKTNFAFLNDSGISSQQFGERLMKSGIVSRDDIQTSWRDLDKNSRSPAALAESLADQDKLTTFQANAVASEDAVPLVLGVYVIQDKLGEGGMGQVFRAVHRKMKREVALKLIAPRVLKDKQTIRRFNREVEAAARLSHPNVVTAYDAGESAGVHYLVMEHVVGRDLSLLVRQSGPFSPQQAVHYVLQAARGLAYAHRQGIVHRDIKPANLLVDTHGTLKILDMGLARIEQDADSTLDGGLTGTGMVMGTIDFMAPEQAFDSKTADARSDIYSLGCTLFYLMTGRAVYEGDTIMKRILAHREHPIPQLGDLIPSVVPELQSALESMLAKDPQQRFQSMEDVINVLTPIMPQSATMPAAKPGRGQTSSTNAFDETLAPSDGTSDTDAGLQPTIDLGRPAKALLHEQETLATAGQEDTIPADQPVAPSISIRTAANDKSHRSRGSRKRKRGPLLLGIGCIFSLAVAGVFYWAMGAGVVEETLVQAGSEGSTAHPDIATNQTPTLSTDSTHSRPSAGESSGLVSDLKLEAIAAEAIAASEPIKTAADVFSKSATNVTAGAAPDSAAFGTPMTTSSSTSPSIASTIESDSVTANSTSMEGIAGQRTNPSIANDSSSERRTLIIGTGEGEIASLQLAFEQALPNDTLLISHRGPLELAPVDLTGKTPLTIKGGSSNGKEFWPIVRQAAIDPAVNLGDAPAWIYGDDLDITFSNLHLGMGGNARQSIGAAFAMASGRVQLDQCTITGAAGDGTDSAIGLPYPLVKVSADGDSDAHISLKECLVRGGRFSGLLHYDGAANVSVSGEQLFWAGGRSPWIKLGRFNGVANVKLDQSTLYNLDSLCSFDGKAIANERPEAPIQFDVNQSVVVGAAGASCDVFRLTGMTEDEGLTPPDIPKLIRWNGQDLVFHDFDKFLPLQGRTAGDLRDFVKVFELNTKDVVDADPMFRVHPAGIELQECDARDFQARPERSQQRASRRITSETGAMPKQVPVALACIMERVLSEDSLASVPRGEPRILKVHQSEGPFRTLEEAFVALQDDDIIEIVDDAVYVPMRDFNLNQAKGVLNVDQLINVTLRTADDSKAVVVLRDHAQRGTLPAFHQDIHVAHNHCLFLISADCRSLKIDGVRFRTDMRRQTHHSFLHSTSPRVRLTNCEFIDLSNAPHAMVIFYWNNGVCYLSPGTRLNDWDHGSISWFENNVIVHPMKAKPLPVEIRGAEVAASLVGSESPRHITFRNCAVGGYQIGLIDDTHCEREYVKFENNTVAGRPIGMLSERPGGAYLFRDNLVICPDNPIPAEPAGLVDRLQVAGSHNAVWLTGAKFSAAARNLGSLRLLPGPILSSIPTFAGRPSNDDLLRPFRLSPKQKYGSMASDLGPIGVRLEYLP